jgi:hypothetical protein
LEDHADNRDLIGNEDADGADGLSRREGTGLDDDGIVGERGMNHHGDENRGREEGPEERHVSSEDKWRAAYNERV